MVKPSARRRALTLGGAGLVLGLAGCAGTEEDQRRSEQPAGNRLLSPWLSLNGGWRADPRPFPGAIAAAGPRLSFVRPVGVAAVGDTVIVADAGARTLWHLNRGRDSMTPLAPFTGAAAEYGGSLQLGADLALWVALPAEHEVVQYDVRGRLVRRWRDEANVPRPVAVAVPDDRSEVLIADGAGARIVAFDPLGRTLALLGTGTPGVLQSIAAMCLGPLGLYVLDREAQQVVVFDRRGAVRHVIGEHHLVRPRALAVDRSGRVFVGDDFDQQIKVFRGDALLGAAGGFGSGPGRFARIESLAVDANLLYVADSGNARVQVMLVAPPSMEAAGGQR